MNGVYEYKYLVDSFATFANYILAIERANNFGELPLNNIERLG